MTTVFSGHRCVWHWEFSQTGEQTITAIATTIKQYASADTLLVKAMDGVNWQSTYDTGAHAISSLASWQSAVAEGAAAGITVYPWVVVNNAAQATTHAQLGNTLIVDLEDDPTNYWNDSISNIPLYFKALRASGVQNIYAAIDPRSYHRTYLGISAWAGLVDGILTQGYWTDFQTPALSNVADVQAIMSLNPNTAPILPYNGTAADTQAFWNACKALGCDSVHLWRLGSANATQLQTFGSLVVPAADPCAALRAQVSSLQAQVAVLAKKITSAQAALSS